MQHVGINIKNDQIAKFAGILSIVEIGLGSFLHALKVPLAGQILSLNQIFIMSYASLKVKDQATPALIGTTAAILKSISPAGKRLTPMLAIAGQGHLFSIGLWIFGVNIIGRVFGAVISSLWAYIQPLCLYLILFGEDIIFIYNYFFKKISKLLAIDHNNFLLILFSMIFLKVIISILLVIISYKIKDEHIEKLESWAKKHKKQMRPEKKALSPIIGALKDLLNPLFIFSMLLTFIFFYFAKSEYSKLVWIILRPIAFGYIIFFILRVMPLENFVKKLKDGKYKDILQKTIKRIQN